jgi:NTE family protein
MQNKLIRSVVATGVSILFVVSTNQAQQAAQPQRPRVGLALSGGGARGLAHIGVLRFLEEQHIPVDRIAGTSMGGLLAGFYATGQSSTDLEKIARNAQWSDLLRFAPSYDDRPVAEKQEWNRISGQWTFRFGKRLSFPAGLNSGQQLALMLSRETIAYSDVHSFDDLPIPFRCVATDLLSGGTFVLQEGSLPKALRATLSLPVIFTPVDWNGRLLIDGGLVNNLPTDVVRDMGADFVIAVTLRASSIERTELNTFTDILRQSVAIATLQNERRNSQLADLVVAVPQDNQVFLDFENVSTIIESGYQAARQNAEALKALSLSPPEWNEYLRLKNSRIRVGRTSGPLVTVRSPQPNIQTDATHELNRKLGPLVSEQKLEDNLTGLTAATGLPSASYRWQTAPEAEGFRIDLEPRPERQLLLRPSIFYGYSKGEPDRFTLRLNSTVILKDAYKSRFLTDLFIGYDPGIRSEYYHPFDGSAFFIAPGILVQRTTFPSYDGPIRTDSTRDRFAGSLYFGIGTWRYLQLRMGAQAGYDRYSEPLTLDGIVAKSTAFVNPEAVGILNTQDSGELPTRGTRINGSLGWSARDRSFPYAKTDFDHFQPLGDTLSVFTLGNVASSFGHKLTFYDRFTAGGLTNLDAYRYQELHANSALAVGGGLIYRGMNLKNAAFRPYLAAWYEVARLDLSEQGWQTRQSTSVGLFAPTPLGTTGLILSFNEKGEARFRLSMGSFWNRP